MVILKSLRYSSKNLGPNKRNSTDTNSFYRTDYNWRNALIIMIFLSSKCIDFFFNFAIFKFQSVLALLINWMDIYQKYFWFKLVSVHRSYVHARINSLGWFFFHFKFMPFKKGGSIKSNQFCLGSIFEQCTIVIFVDVFTCYSNASLQSELCRHKCCGKLHFTINWRLFFGLVRIWTDWKEKLSNFNHKIYASSSYTRWYIFPNKHSYIH